MFMERFLEKSVVDNWRMVKENGITSQKPTWLKSTFKNIYQTILLPTNKQEPKSNQKTVREAIYQPRSTETNTGKRNI